MANASKNHMGAGAQGKSSGTGAMTDLQKDRVGENQILSNRDKAQHTSERSLDGKFIQAEQYQDDPANRLGSDAPER